MINLKHPEGKQGARIQKSKYETIKAHMLLTIEEFDEISYKQLTQEMNKRLKGIFDGSVTWYVTAVKLDLEARGIIERYKFQQRQYIKMVKN